MVKVADKKAVKQNDNTWQRYLLRRNSVPHFDYNSIFKTQFKFKSPSDFLKLTSPEDVANNTDVSSDLVKNIIQYEGFSNKAYRDLAGVETVGVGHNIDADKNYAYGKNITDEQVYNLLANDLKQAEKDVKSCTPHAKLNKNQTEALTDLFFNVGANQLENSKLIKDINNGKFDDAACEFNFVTSKNKVYPGLCQRRIGDIDKFCSGHYTTKSFKELKTIYVRGLNSFDEIIKSASGQKKRDLIQQKNNYVKYATPIIEKGQHWVSTHSHVNVKA